MNFSSFIFSFFVSIKKHNATKVSKNA